MKNLPRLLLVAAAVVVAVVLLAWAALAILFPPAKVRALVEQQASNALARPVRFESASLGLFPPVRLSIRGLALAEPGGFGNGAAFQAQTFALDLDAFALLGRKVVVKRLVLDRPALHLVLKTDGTTNLDGLAKEQPAPRPGEKPMDLRVDALEIRDGQVLVDRLLAKQRVAFGIGAKLAFSSEQGGARLATDGRTEVSDLAFGPLSASRLADLNGSLAKIRWTLEHRGKYDANRKRLALERVALAFGGAAFEASGLVDDVGATPAVDLKAKGERVNLAEILRVLSAADAKALAGLSGAGDLSFDLGIRGRMSPGSSPKISGTLALANGAFKYASAPVGVEALSFHANFAPDSVGIGDLRCRVSGQPVAAQLTAVRFADPRVTFAVQGNVDLAAVAPMVAPKDTKLAGRAAVNVRGAGRAKDPGSIVLSGTATLADVSVQSPQLPSRLEHVKGDLAFSNERATVKGLSLTAGKSSLAMNATVTRPLALVAKPGSVAPATVDFDFASPYLDVAEVLPAGGGGPVLPNANGGGDVRITRLKNGALDVSNVSAKVALEPAVLVVPAFGLDGYGGRVAGNARFDLRDPATPVTKLVARVDSLSADALLSAWTPAKGWLDAKFNTNLDLAVAGSTPDQVKRSLTAIGIAALGGGTLGPGPVLDEIAKVTRIPAFRQVRFSDLDLPFRVEQGRVVTNPVKLSGSYGEWVLAGSIGFDGALDYAVSVTLPPEAAAALQAKSALAAGALSDDRGRLLLDLRVRGSAKAPKVDWDTRAMRDRLAGRASEALTEQKQKLTETLKPATNPLTLAAPESLAKVKESLSRITADSLKKSAGDLLKGFFGTKKKSELAPAPAAPAPAAPAPAAADSAK